MSARGSFTLEEHKLPVHSANTLVIGSGAAGLNAALRLHELGARDVILATECFTAGASFNAGSDKQTYYKLSLAGTAADSPRRLAEDLFRGGCMHGDIALCEAQHSAEAFFRLVHLGVPFPHDRFGGFVGYRTDHDPLGRGTSAGPLTSRTMCECLARAVCARGIPILDDHPVAALLFDRDEKGRTRVRGALAIHKPGGRRNPFGFTVFNARNVVLATGGPGGIWRDGVYPPSQIGSLGLALAAGAAAQNLTECQFGLASTVFRWNLSGSYQQAIPAYVSTDPEGGDPREFLLPFFPDLRALAGAIFRKGYEWPFDAERVGRAGSSLIDLLVFRERKEKGRRVFLDFRRNPGGDQGRGRKLLDVLDPEARGFLRQCGALKATPIQRLNAMNPQATALFRSQGIDLEREPLEAAVCAQHLNGGLKGDLWWESNVRGLFPVGEANGSHGVRRPGGAALNAGQVGSARAALYIARRRPEPPPPLNVFLKAVGKQIRAHLDFGRKLLENGRRERGIQPGEAIAQIQDRMSDFGAHVRDPANVPAARKAAWVQLDHLKQNLAATSLESVPLAFRALDLCLTHAFVLEAVHAYLEKGGRSRGSFLVLDPAGRAPCRGLGKGWRFTLTPADAFVNGRILELWLDAKGKPRKRWSLVRPIPEGTAWFESVWKAYRENRIVRKEKSDG